MNKVLLFLFLGLSVISSNAQTQSVNYVKNKTYLAPSIELLAAEDTTLSYAYSDGLGRPMQMVAVGAGGTGEDLVVPMSYDAYGRQVREYLPFSRPTSGGDFVEEVLIQQANFYNSKYGNVPNPYAEKVLDASPLHRILEQGAPGEPWMADATSDNDHTIKYEYHSNTLGDEVRVYSVELTVSNYGEGLATYFPTLLDPSIFYPVGALYKTITKDENWQPGDDTDHTMEEYKNKSGQVLLSRSYNGLEVLNTYYVYDDHNNLTYVIPPLVNTDDGISEEELGGLCYQYTYDHRNRLVEKQLPGKLEEYMIYNDLDLPVLVQDGNLRSKGQWLYTKYDSFSRPVQIGIYDDPSDRIALQQLAIQKEALSETRQSVPIIIDMQEVYYSNWTFPTNDLTPLSIAYYDSYPSDLAGGVSEDSYGTTPTLATKGLPVMTRVRMLETTDWINTVTYYDEKARPIYIYSHNEYLGTTDKVKSDFDFTGRTIGSTFIHSKPGQMDNVIVEGFTYDNQGRVLTHSHKINDQAVQMLEVNDYDDLGQLVTKSIGGVQEMDFTYNIRGWLTHINNGTSFDDAEDLFGMELAYEAAGQYNGNIGTQQWKTIGGQNMNDSTQSYAYTYDPLNRLSGSEYVSEGIDGHFNTGNFSYDLNGNIESLQRYHEGILTDDLVYSYEGNQLTIVDDVTNAVEGFTDIDNPGVEYTYDENGNMLTDANKGITGIEYNILNLPRSVILPDGDGVEYYYSFDGIKQRKVTTTGLHKDSTDYAGVFHYTNKDLSYIHHSLGRVLKNGGVFNYEYNLVDHLGNVRAVVDESGQLKQRQDYYPFGLTFNNWHISPENLHKYNGKEEQQETGWLDYGARMYEPALGRWFNIDPKSELYKSYSPYHFVGGNPIKNIDDNGESYAFYLEQTKSGDWRLRITATYFVGKDDKKSYNAARLGASFWNGQSGKFSIELTDENGEKSQIGIDFDIKVKKVDDPIGELYKDSRGHKDALTDDRSGNVFKVLSDNAFKAEPGTSPGSNGIAGIRTAKIPEKNSRWPEAIAHEMGHNIGVSHKYGGLMDASKVYGVNSSHIKQIFERVIISRLNPNSLGPVKRTKSRIPSFNTRPKWVIDLNREISEASKSLF